MKIDALATIILVIGLSACNVNPGIGSTQVPLPQATQVKQTSSATVTPQLTHGCDQLNRDFLGGIRLNEVKSQQTFNAWLQHQPDVDNSSITTQRDLNDTVTRGWSTSRTENYAYFDSSGRLAFISIEWQGSKPNLRLILACFGAPTSYRALQIDNAYMGPPYIEADIWYPERGIVFILTGEKRKEQLTDNAVVSEVRLVAPGDAKAMVSEAYPATYFDAHAEYVKLHLKQPWPDRLEDVKVDPVPTGN